MRTALTIICFGFALGLAGLACVMIGYGIYTERQALAEPSLAIGIFYSMAAYRITLGCAALIGAGLFGAAAERWGRA